MKFLLWLLSLSTVIAFAASTQNTYDSVAPIYNEDGMATALSTEGRNMLWNNVQDVFRRISSFFSFSKPIDRQYNHPNLIRRPEMLPLEMRYPKNRRSGHQELLERRSDKKFLGSQQQPYSYKKKYSSSTSLGPRFKKVESKYSPNYSSQKLSNNYVPFDRFSPSSGKKEQTSFQVIHMPKESGSSLTAETSPQGTPYHQHATKIESREPVVAVYSNSGSKRGTMKTKPTHSKYPTISYSDDKRKKISNTFQKNPSSDSRYDSFVVGSSFSHDPSKALSTNHVSQLPNYSKSNLMKKPLPQLSSNDLRLSREENLRPFFLTPPSRSVLLKHPKTLFDNMSGFATNLFKRIFPPKTRTFQPTPVRRVRTLADTQRDLSGFPSHQAQVPIHQPWLQTNQLRVEQPSQNKFDASPKEGSMSADAFQPLFNPSPSLDKDLPFGSMKPMNIVEKREIKAEPVGLTEPEIIDFFHN